VTRIASFIKRISALSITLPPNKALACLVQIKSGFKKFPKLLTLVDGEGRLGIYESEVDDPDLCNPFGSSLWELPLLMVSTTN
jgi:nucleolar complex protein 3